MGSVEMKVEIISRETIKPSSPTPSNLKTCQLSFLDRLTPPIYCRMVYFYPKNDSSTSSSTSEKLKKSLSKTLARFYPIAGRIINNTTIECNDEGAQYVEARCHDLLSNFLEQQSNLDLLQQSIPAIFQSPETGTWPQLIAQATFFDCGGLALDVCASHKFMDATTIGTFMKSWAETSNGSDQTVVPVFDGANYFPPADPSLFKLPHVEAKKVECVTKRFVFDKSKVMDLKAKISSQGIHNPTRVQAVTALIWKCAIAAASKSNSEAPNKFSLSQTMNIRRRAEPPLPEGLVGNVTTFVSVVITKYEDELELKDLVPELRKGIKEFAENKSKRLRGDDAAEAIFEDIREFGELMGKDDTYGLVFSSLCNFQIYEAGDFGWGKPIWVTVPVATGHNNFIRLMDTRDGGVEAFVTLSKEDMALFDRDAQLLDFAYISSLTSFV